MTSENKSTFFKQSIWMVVATFAGGVFMVLVHTIAKRMDPNPELSQTNYTEFFTLLRILSLLSIPTAGLQAIFAQQAAAAIDDFQTRQLRRTVRFVMAGTFLLWAIMALAVFATQNSILQWQKLSSASALWVTMLVVLVSLWLPILRGVLQGQQHFMGMAWVSIFDGIGRFVAVAIIVLVLNGKTAGAMSGALFGQICAILIAIWTVKTTIFGATEKFDFGNWLRRVVPLTIGVGVLIFVQTADAVFVKGAFEKSTADLYMPANMIGFALVQFAGPITAVMFPKVVRSAARSEKTDALKLTFLTTALVGGLSAIACTLLPKLPLQIIYMNDPRFVASAPLVPWFAWSMALMILAAVLINNLLARQKFGVVPWLICLAVGYWLTLQFQKEQLHALEPMLALKRIVFTVGTFSFLLLAVSAWFTWGKKEG